jgi:arginine deiminase
MEKSTICVNSEIGRLRRLIIHSPDGGIGKVIPAKFKDWLYDDTVQLSQMRQAYCEYVKLLLYFLDPEKIAYIRECESRDPEKAYSDCFKPDSPAYFNSSKVLDTQFLLSEILKDGETRKRIISAVCAWEGCGLRTERKLEGIESTATLAKVLISGIYRTEDHREEFLFQPLPNFIFTRDIGIAINDQLLLSNAATSSRERESLLMRFIAQYGMFADRPDSLIEIGESSSFFLLSEEEQAKYKVSVEGGDVMMIAPGHLLIGCSERTTPAGVNEVIHSLFENRDTGIEKVTVIHIPKHRAMMHIDTVFTQVSRDTWVLFGQFSEYYRNPLSAHGYSYINSFGASSQKNENKFRVRVTRFYKPLSEKYDANKNYQQDISENITGLDSLLVDISRSDFGVEKDKVTIIYSGGGKFPYDEREQWTDSCNLLALKEGVVVGYDRNEKTIQAFREHGFQVWRPEELFEVFDRGELSPDTIEKSLIILQSNELSRARGGSHCMSFPLLREPVKL